MTDPQPEDRKPISMDGIRNFDFKKNWKPFAVAGIALAAITGGMIYQHTNQETPQSNTTPSVSASVFPSSKPSTETSGQTATSNPAPSAKQDGGKYVPQQNVEKSQVELAATNFMKNIGSGKSGEAWANSMKTMVTDAFYESLKHASPASIPKGAVDVSVSDGEDSWTATAVDKDGNSLYKFHLSGYQNLDGNSVILVPTMEIPEQEPKKDKNGYPIPNPVPPLSPAGVQNLEAQAYTVAKYYFEFTSDQTEQERTQRLKAVVHGGPVPKLRPVVQGKNFNVQMYGATNVRPMVSAEGDSARSDAVSIGMTIRYADAYQPNPQPWEEVNIAVDFQWDETTTTWSAAGLRLIGVRPLKAS